MKQVLALFFALIMMATLLTACGEHEHVYDNPCDTQCNECEATRTIQHVYADDADHYCDVCKGHRLVGTWSTTIEDQPGEITLNADGTGKVLTHEADRPCTWMVHEDGTLTVEQDVKGIPYTLFNKVSFVFEGSTLILTSQSGNTLVLTGK